MMTPHEVMKADRGQLIGEVCQLQLRNAKLIDDAIQMRASWFIWVVVAIVTNAGWLIALAVRQHAISG